MIAPALIPRRPGDRIKTDRRDAGQLGDAVSRRRADGDSHSDRAGRSRPRSAALSRGHSRRSAARAPSALEVPAAPRPALHRRRRRRGRSATTPGCGRRRGRCPRSTRRTRPICATVDEAVARLRAVEAGSAGAARSRAAARPRPAAALLPRHRRSHRADDRGRTRRSAPLPDGARARWPSSGCAVGAFQRHQTGPRRASPRRAMPICGACSSKPRGTIATIPSSAPRCGAGKHGAPADGHRARVDRAAAAAIVATTDSPRAANRTSRSSPPWPAS